MMSDETETAIGLETYYVLRRTYLKHVTGQFVSEYCVNILTTTSWLGVVYDVRGAYRSAVGSEGWNIIGTALKFWSLNDAREAVRRLSEFEHGEGRLPEIVKVVANEGVVRGTEVSWRPPIGDRPEWAMDWLDAEHRRNVAGRL